MAEDAHRLRNLIASVADGSPIDWDALARSGADDDIRVLLQHLQTVAGVARIHRSVLEDGEPETVAGRPAAGPTTQWGRFLLIRKLGEGAFGEVYHARDGLLDHDVALKLLRPHLGDQSRILHEARTLVRVRHPNVVSVHGADVHEGRVGFWMEMIDGHTLAEVVAREGVRSASEAAVIGQDLCRALAAVHTTGIVHRDIKAKNVMRQAGGRVVLMDFGAGEMMKPRSAYPQLLAGTPLYLAPELFEGAPATVQSDIYALGVLMFYLVTRKYPVQGSEFDDLVRAHTRGERQHLGDLRPDLPDTFVRVVDTMLAPDAARRYATAGTARAALEAVVVASNPVSVVEPGRRPAPRARVWWLSPGVLAFAMVAMVGLITTASFNQTFGRTGGFADDTPFDWIIWGFRSLIAPLTYMAIATVLISFVVAAARVFCRIVPPAGSLAVRIGGAVSRLARQHAFEDPNLLMQLVTAVGALGVAILIWAFWDEVTAFAIFIDTAPAEDLMRLQPANAPRFDAYARLLEQLMVLYGFCVYGVFRIARRARAVIHPAVKAVAVAVPLVALLLMRALPYRTVYQNDVFERVDLVDQRCYRIGMRPGEILLHCADTVPPRNRVISTTDPRLRPRGVIESVFTPRGRSTPVN
jgi:hypothetical protein